MAAGALVALAACSSGGYGPAPAPTPQTTTTAPPAAEVTVRGVVGSVFTSARVVVLAQPVDGIATLALSADTEFLRANGAPGALSDVAPGMAVEATGRRTTPDALLARKVVLSP